MRRDERIRWGKLRWDEVWSVKSAVWSVGREAQVLAVFHTASSPFDIGKSGSMAVRLSLKTQRLSSSGVTGTCSHGWCLLNYETSADLEWIPSVLLRWNRSMAMRRMSTSHRCDCALRMKDGTFSSTATVAPGLIFYALSAATKSASSRAFISLIHGNCRLPCLMRLSFRIGHMLNHLQPPAAYMRHCVCGVAESLAWKGGPLR